MPTSTDFSWTYTATTLGEVEPEPGGIFRVVEHALGYSVQDIELVARLRRETLEALGEDPVASYANDEEFIAALKERAG